MGSEHGSSDGGDGGSSSSEVGSSGSVWTEMLEGLNWGIPDLSSSPGNGGEGEDDALVSCDTSGVSSVVGEQGNHDGVGCLGINNSSGPSSSSNTIGSIALTSHTEGVAWGSNWGGDRAIRGGSKITGLERRLGGGSGEESENTILFGLGGSVDGADGVVGNPPVNSRAIIILGNCRCAWSLWNCNRSLENRQEKVTCSCFLKIKSIVVSSSLRLVVVLVGVFEGSIGGLCHVHRSKQGT